MKKIIIIGGGLAGLLSSIQLARAGMSCIVIEKKSYPFHRVCGEYISNEALPFLKSMDLFPADFNPPHINRFLLSSVNGRHATLPLDTGGFGISRYTYDHFLFQRALAMGVTFHLNQEALDVNFEGEIFEVTTKEKKIHADVVIAAHGKRSRLDHTLNRSFMKKKSPFVGIKYHIKRDHPNDLIALHNFKGGYCGMSNIEENKTNLCYLTHRDNLKKYGSIDQMQQAVLYENPFLKDIFTTSEFLFKNPEVINEISFETKQPVENHMLMVGDAAGMITPLCGNGMAMAIHSSKIACSLITAYVNRNIPDRETLEKEYTQQWSKTFSNRLWKGRQVQRLFGSDVASNFALTLAISSKPIANAIIRNTHGPTF